ncbi:MAG: helix-turn-helix domain-containing protein [Victivallaceae bacterium]
MNISIPELEWQNRNAEPNATQADMLIRESVLRLIQAADRGELRSFIGSSRNRWDEAAQSAGCAHAFSDEWFFQLQGECDFRFSSDEHIKIIPGDTLLVPRGVPHIEIVGNRDGKTFTSLVLCVCETTATLHLARPSPERHSMPEVFRVLRLHDALFYRGLIMAVQHTSHPDTIRQLLGTLFRQFQKDIGSIMPDDQLPFPHRLAVQARHMINSCPVDHWYTVVELAKKLQCSPNYLSSVFHRSYGIKLKEFLICNRLENAKIMLLDNRLNASEVASNCGFQDTAYFARIFRQRFGCTPSELRKMDATEK